MKVLENYFDTDRIPDYCTKEKLEKFYGYYLKNLKACPYKSKWVTLNEIEKREATSWECIGDQYLIDSKDDKTKLAMDIYQNGTYFPIFVTVAGDAPYKLRDGIHRIYAMRQLVDMGCWDKERKILIVTNEKADEPQNNEQPVYYLPLVVKEEFKDNYSLMYKELSDKDQLTYADTEKEFAEFRSGKGGYLAMSCMSLLLRNAFFEYRQKYGEPISPSPVINDIEMWKKWRGY